MHFLIISVQQQLPDGFQQVDESTPSDSQQLTPKNGMISILNTSCMRIRASSPNVDIIIPKNKRGEGIYSYLYGECIDQHSQNKI